MARTILVVDDNLMELDMLSGMLESEYRVLAATSGEETIDMLRKHAKTVSAILLDLIMPKMDGFEVLRRIRDNAVYRQIPVIVTTALTDSENQIKALSLGANGYVFKPYNKPLLLYTLENAIALREKSALVNTFRRDPLTGLPNRAAFFETVQTMLRAKHSGYYILSCVDIESFKIINDQYGFETGDEVLKAIAAAISATMQSLDGVCCRYSGDKFGLLYPAAHKDTEELEQLHKRISISKHIGRTIRVRIGRYYVDDGTVPISAMFDRAQMAEESIRGRYDTHIAEYDESMRLALLKEQRIVNDMVRALSEGEFEPWFQPQYNHATGAITGAEALVRWKKDGRFIAPIEFVPVFERNGFIYEMDQHIWDRVCRLQRKWLDEGRNPLPVSINISRRDLFHQHFIEVLTGIIDRYSLPYALIHLEVTESAFAESSGQIISKVSELIRLGFTVEIDDFGSGYSSLNTLKDVPASVLKLDMRFFENTDNRQRGGNIVESVVRMAEWLGMAVIAEGVEDVEQADYLRSIGCNYIQGYYYAKPMPVKDYEKLLFGSNTEGKLNRLKTVKNLNNNEFWNPKSMETLIFNSYVGGACIFEYHGGKAQLLRFNEQYPYELGKLLPENDRLDELSPIRFMDAENELRMFDNIRAAIATEREATCEIILRDLSEKTPQVEYIRTTVRVIAQAGERYLFYCVVVNITEQRVAEKLQLEAARKLEVIMSNVNGGVSAIVINDDATSKLIFTNDKYFELYGYSREEATNLDIMKTVVPEDLPELLQKIRKLKADGEPAIIDYRIMRRDGRRAFLRANCSLMFMEDYGYVIASVVTDITEHRELSDKLQAVIDNINGGVSAIYIKDGAPKLIIVNDRYFEIAGYTREQFYSEVKNVFELVHPDDRERIRQQFNEAAERRGRYSMEYRIVRRDKEIRRVLCNTNVISLFGVSETVQLAVTNDITELRDAQQKELETADRLRVVLNNAGNGITAIALAEDNTEFLFANDCFFSMMGYSREGYFELTRDDMFAAIFEDDREKTRHVVSELNRSSGTLTLEYRIKRADGGLMWIRSAITITSLAGIGVPVQIAVFSDVTREHETSERLNALHKTEQEGLLQSQRERNRLLDNLPCGAALYEFDGKNVSVLHINKSYWELVGREPVDYSTASVFDVIHADDHKRIYNEISASIREKRSFKAIIRILCAGGSYKPFSLSAKIEHCDNGNYRFYATYAPVSEQAMKMEEMLPVALSTMMAVSEDISYIKDRELHYISCSKTAAEKVGLHKPAEVVGKTDTELFGEALGKQFGEADRRIIESGAAQLGTTERIPRRDGGVAIAYTSKYPILDGNGEVVGIYGTSRDITAQREKESQLELLTSSIAGGLATYSISDTGIKILYFNDGFFAFSGCSREEYAGKIKTDPLAFVFDEDKPKIRAMIADFRREKTDGHVNGCVYRCHTSGGGYCWMSLKTVLAKLSENDYVVNVIQLDITEQEEEKENLRVSEELNRLAIQLSGNVITRFDVKSRTLTLPDSLSPVYELPQVLNNMPYEQIELGRISPDTADAYAQLFEDICCGSSSGTAVYKQRTINGWRWLEAHYTTVYSRHKHPVSAVISFTDVTDRLEKEVVYTKWQQSLSERLENSYTLFRCNLSRGTVFDSREGKLLRVQFDGGKQSFNERTVQYARQYVYSDDYARYVAFVDSDRMLSEYHAGHRSDSIEYRECDANDKIRWLRLSIDLVEYPGSRDIEAYLMYEDIDEKKRADLLTLERSEKDPLTGILNRAAFIARMEKILAASKPDKKHALLMLDVDNFKHVNDTMGHGAGDKVLMDLTRQIGSILRHDDLIGRMGGDEFFVFLRDIPGEETAAAKAMQICSIKTTLAQTDKPVTASVGIAMIPKDGSCFDELYKKVDAALYRRKQNGKNGFLFVDGTQS